MKKLTLMMGLLILIATNLFPQENTIQVDSGYVNVDGGKLYYEMAGNGKNIVLLHDGMVDRQIWDEQFLVLAKNYRVVRYDRRAYGKSSNPQTNYSHIDDLNQVFDQLKIDKAIIFGMSSGGGLAIDFTLQYPEKVSGLVLVGAVVGGYGYSSHFITRGGHFDRAIYSNSEKVQKYFVEDDPYEIVPKNTQAKEKVKKIMEGAISTDIRNDGYYPFRPERTAVKFLSEIKVPTLILVGEFDIPDVHAHSGVINAGIENSKREIIPNSAHLIPIEQPGLFNEAVMKFLSELSR